MKNDDYELDAELSESDIETIYADIDLLQCFVAYHGQILEILMDDANLSKTARRQLEKAANDMMRKLKHD